MSRSKYADIGTLLPLFLVILIDSMGLGILFPILNPVFMGDHSIVSPTLSQTNRYYLYGITLAVFPLFSFFASSILGDLSDQIGRKKVLLVCLVGAAISYFFSGYAIEIHSVTLLIASRIIAGLTAGSQGIAQAAVIDVSPPESKALNISLILVPISLGFVAGPLVGAYLSDGDLVSWFALSTPLYFAAALSLLNIVLLFRGFKETHTHLRKLQVKISRSLTLVASAFQIKPLRKALLSYFCMQLGWSSYFQFISLFLSNKFHFTPNTIGLFMALMAMGFTAGSIYFIKVALRFFKEEKISLYGLIITSLMIMLTFTTSMVGLTWVSTFVLAICIALVYTTQMTVLSNEISEDYQGYLMGIIMALGSLAWTITAVGSTWLETINTGAPLIVGFLFTALGAFYMWFHILKTPVVLDLTPES